MKLMKHIPLMLALVVLFGCTTTFRPWMLSEIKEGMEGADVVTILGDPDSSELKEGEELWYYSYSENYNPTPADADISTFDTTRSLQDRDVTRSFKEYRYVVILVDGKVQTYKEIQ